MTHARPQQSKYLLRQLRWHPQGRKTLACYSRNLGSTMQSIVVAQVDRAPCTEGKQWVLRACFDYTGESKKANTNRAISITLYCTQSLPSHEQRVNIYRGEQIESAKMNNHQCGNLRTTRQLEDLVPPLQNKPNNMHILNLALREVAEKKRRQSSSSDGRR